MPLVRERVGRELGIRVDLDLDPMTSVAFGASVFAEGQEWATGCRERAKARIGSEQE